MAKTKAQLDRESYQRHREKRLAWQKEYRKRNPLPREKANEKARRWRKANADLVRRRNMIRWYAKRNAWLAANGPCIRCGSNERLEVDHINPKTKIDHKVWSWGKERREAELLKCQILCFVCHRLKTNEERGWKLHGELMWQRGCRCKECVRVHNKKLRKQARDKLKVRS